MSDSSTHDPPEGVPEEDQTPTKDAFTELRKLLLGPEQAQLHKLQERLDNPDLHANDVSQVLPEAITLRSSRDQKIAQALEPSTEEAIKASIKRDRKVLVDALFPVMGPAIRKAIYSTILGMIQSFNQILLLFFYSAFQNPS